MALLLRQVGLHEGQIHMPAILGGQGSCRWSFGSWYWGSDYRWLVVVMGVRLRLGSRWDFALWGVAGHDNNLRISLRLIRVGGRWSLLGALRGYKQGGGQWVIGTHGYLLLFLRDGAVLDRQRHIHHIWILGESERNVIYPRSQTSQLKNCWWKRLRFKLFN